MLKDLRKKLSKKLEVPPYVIFQDPSLEAMATIYPVTLEELQNIPGVEPEKPNATVPSSVHLSNAIARRTKSNAPKT